MYVCSVIFPLSWLSSLLELYRYKKRVKLIALKSYVSELLSDSILLSVMLCMSKILNLVVLMCTLGIQTAEEEYIFVYI